MLREIGKAPHFRPDIALPLDQLRGQNRNIVKMVVCEPEGEMPSGKLKKD